MAIPGSSSPEDKPILPPLSDFTSTLKSKTLEEVTPWIDIAVQQARTYQKTVEDTLDTATITFRSRFSEIRSTSSAHFNQTIDSLQDFKDEFDVYENIVFGKVKDSVKVAAAHPLIAGSVAVGLGLVVLKRPRRFLYQNTLRLFMSEEALLKRADAKVKELQNSFIQLRAESEKLERGASLAETEFIRGRTKLRQAGKQIRGVIHSAYKIEKQAAGLKDILRELPKREASKFQSQVSKLDSEAKQQKNELMKEVTKISNYGISV